MTAGVCVIKIEECSFLIDVVLIFALISPCSLFVVTFMLCLSKVFKVKFFKVTQCTCPELSP